MKELKELHRKAYNPSHLVVAAAGNVDHDHLVELLSRTGWHGRVDRPSKAVTSAAPKPGKPTRRFVKRPGSQTHIVLG